jgi:chloramphenicol 3-O-phosphotransferase
MAEIVIVNGPPRVGKSSVTAILRELVPGTVAISGGELRAFAPPDARAHLGGGATYRIAGALTRAFLELGAARVIFDYVLLRPAHIRYFREALPDATSVHSFLLWAPLECLLARENERAERPPFALDVADCYREMAQNQAQLGELIDNTRVTAAEAAARIHERLSARDSDRTA